MPTILLIDDSPQIGALLGQIPRLYADWQLLIATNGPRGIEVFRQHLPRIDAILLDVLMPGMDGYWTCFMLRKLSARVAIIPYTGASCDERLFAQFACAAPVTKPIALDELLHKIRAAIAEAATFPPMEHSPLVTFVQRHAATMEQQLSGLPERQQRILVALREHGGELSAAEISALLNEPHRNIQRDLSALIRQGVLTAVGETHQRRYRLKA